MVKKRKLTVLITILCILATVSIGFAAWVITNDANKSTEGNIQVDVVDDKRLGMEASIKDNESIIFGAKAKAEGVQYDWLKYEQSVTDANVIMDEHLTVYLSLTIENYSYLADEVAIVLTVAEAEGKTVYKEALEAGYVGNLPSMNISKEQLIDYAAAPLEKELADKQAEYAEVIAASGANSAEAIALDEQIKSLTSQIENLRNGNASSLSCDIPITFNWGAKFNGLNPIDYYNSFEYDEDLANETEEVLKDLFNKLNSTTYVVKVEANAK